MHEIIRAVSNGLELIASAATSSVLLAMAAVGTISMAFLETVKSLVPMRRRFQTRWIDEWVRIRVNTFEALEWRTDDRPADVTASKARRQIVELSTGGEENALFSMMIEDLTAQMAQGAQITLDNPRAYAAALNVLASGAPVEDLRIVMNGQDNGVPAQEYFDARGRVGRRIQRNLDGIRIACGDAWRYRMQWASIVITVAIVEYAVFVSEGGLSWAAVVALPIAVTGSYFAPVTRDLVAALQKLRKP